MSNGNSPIIDYSSTNTNQQSNEALKNIDKNIEISVTQNKEFMKDFSWSGIGGAFSTIAIQSLSAIKKSYDTLGKGLEDGYGAYINNIEEFRRVYGGLKKGKEFEFIPKSSVSQALRRFESVRMAYSNNDKIIRSGMEKTGHEVLTNITNTGENIFKKYFENAEQASEKIESILTDMTTTYGEHIAKLSDEQVAKLAFYEDSLGVSANNIQKVFQKQIGFTDEISLDSLDRIGAYASKLSTELNIPMKHLTNMSIQMMANTEMFGDITDVEATRMAAKLTQLGYTYEELNAVQSKFSSFSGAAQAAGTMAQLTGVQVDAMKMSYLSSEGKFDELIEYQRDSLLKAGMTKEKFLSQSNSMKNAIAKAFGRSQEELAYLLDSNRKISSQEELNEMMGGEEEAKQEGFDTLLENLNQTKRSFQDINDTANELSKNLYVEKAQEAYTAGQNLSVFNTALSDNMKIVGADAARFNELTDSYLGSINQIAGLDGKSIGFEDFATSITSAVSKMGGDAIAVVGEATGISDSLSESVAELGSLVDGISDNAERVETLQQTISETTANQTNKLSEDLANHFGIKLEGALKQMPEPKLNLSEGAVQVFVDSTKIPISGVQVKQ